MTVTCLQEHRSPILDEMMRCSIRVNFHQQTVETVIVEVTLPRNIKEHEEAVVPVGSRGNNTRSVLLIEVELFA